MDRKFRMTLKVTPKKQRMTPRMVNMTPRMTPGIEEWNSLLLKQTSKMIVWWSINDCLRKEKLDGIPYTWKSYFSLLLRSKKNILWHFSETRINRYTDIKKHITSANERNKAHFKRVQSHCYNRPLKFGDKGSLVYSYSIYTLD